jgi:hypothetical protein
MTSYSPSTPGFDPWIGTRKEYDATTRTSQADQVMLGRVEAALRPLEQLISRLQASELDANDYVARDIVGRLTNLAGLLSTRMRAK